MILVDENTPTRQFVFLERRHRSARKVGSSWGRGGMSDQQILAELRGMRQVTFLTGDADFYRRAYCHRSFCLVFVSALPAEFAAHVIRFLRHPSFRTNALRMGKVIRVQPTGIIYWQLNATREIELPWP